MERHVGIRQVVTERSREEHDVEAAERAAPAIRFERAPQVPEVLLRAPGYGAILVDALPPKLRDRCRVVTGQFLERVLAIPGPVEVEEVIRRLLLESCRAPRIGI